MEVRRRDCVWGRGSNDRLVWIQYPTSISFALAVLYAYVRRDMVGRRNDLSRSEKHHGHCQDFSILERTGVAITILGIIFGPLAEELCCMIQQRTSMPHHGKAMSTHSLLNMI